MKKFVSYTLNYQLAKRYDELMNSAENPLVSQKLILQNLLKNASETAFGKANYFKSLQSPEQFSDQVEIQDYNSLKPFIEKILRGEENILWPGAIRWFAKSSGTTSDKSKYIPVSLESLDDCHFKAGKDLISVIFHNRPHTEIYFGNGLVLGGSHQLNTTNHHSSIGDLSAILMQNLPFWAKLWQQPSLRTSQISDWEIKIQQMAKEVVNKNITYITGVPSWTLVLMKQLLENSGKNNILDLWPKLELYVHGGVNFDPYRQSFSKLIPKEEMYYLETYNASEGFFGLQDQLSVNDMLLLVDHGVYYEFIPTDIVNPTKKDVIGLDKVQTGVNYALVITTNSGLWRYLIGDTVRFTSTFPFRFRLSGRTRNFINAFGEELIIENADKAIAIACEATHSEITDYTAGPIYLSENSKGTHEWLIEFSRTPDDVGTFTQILDQSLKDLNSDYEAKRFKDMALTIPKINILPEGTFYHWMKQRGKLGGQNKVPRLFNDRTYVDDIKSFAGIE